MNKYIYLKVIQANYGYGWEDVASYNSTETAELKHDYHEYCISTPEYPHRIIARRKLNK